ncbi:hypothetical protein ACGC1H_004904 [Rhizoctonia solani]
MAYSGYRTDLPFVVTNADERQGQYCANTPGYQDVRFLAAPEPWVPNIPGISGGPSTQHVGMREPLNDAYPPSYYPSPAPPRNLHVATNVPRINTSSSVDMWPQSGLGIGLVQSPNSYLPTYDGVPSITRHKIVHITFGANHAQFDLTRYSDAGSIRRDIISRFLPTVTSFCDFDIFRTYPPGPAEALNDTELMLDIEHFGDNRGTLRFLVQAADEHSDSHLPTYARGPSLYHSHSTGFPSPSPIPSPRNSTVGSDAWHGFDTPTSGARGYTHSPSQSLESHSTYSPSRRVSMPIPMPAPAPTRQLTEPQTAGFPTNRYSTLPAITPAIEGPSAETFARHSAFINHSELSRSHTMVSGHPRNTSDYYGRENTWGRVADGHDGQYQPRASRADVRPHSVVISGTMATEEVLSHLYERGCRNVATELDESRISRDPVARGGGGDVYSGQLYTGKRVALKCVRLAIGNEDCSKLKKTAHELYVWSKCNHPNVLELIGVTHHRDQVAMVSPWMDNGDLRAFLRLYPAADRHDLCVQMADGVAYLHAQNIVHGDIKGANVLISQDGEAKITDFGTSALKEYTLEFATTRSKPGLSIRWAAPEILDEQSENSYEADVYALGMTMLEAMTGAVPYAHISRESVVMRHIIGGILPVRPEAHIPRGADYGDLFWSLLNQCWLYDHQSRPTAVEIQHQIRNIFI